MNFPKPPRMPIVFFPERTEPRDASMDDIIHALEVVVGPTGLDSLQHQGGLKFYAVVANAESATKLTARSAIVVNGVSTPVAGVRPRVIYVTVYRLRLFIGDAELASALAPYGKALAIQQPTFRGRPRVGNGARLVHIEMQLPIPNFLSVHGCRV